MEGSSAKCLMLLFGRGEVVIRGTYCLRVLDSLVGMMAVCQSFVD